MKNKCAMHTIYTWLLVWVLFLTSYSHKWIIYPKSMFNAVLISTHTMTNTAKPNQCQMFPCCTDTRSMFAAFNWLACTGAFLNLLTVQKSVGENELFLVSFRDGLVQINHGNTCFHSGIPPQDIVIKTFRVSTIAWNISMAITHQYASQYVVAEPESRKEHMICAAIDLIIVSMTMWHVNA